MEKKGTLTDWLGVIVALGGLFIAWHSFEYQNEFARQTQIAAQQPLLNIEYLKADSNENYGFVLKNLGSGTAIIETFNIYINDQAYNEGVTRAQWLENGQFWFDNEEQYWYENINNLIRGHAIANSERGDTFLLSTRAFTKLQIDSGNDNQKDRGFFYNTAQAKALCKTIIEITYKSASTIDNNVYVLTFSESFVQNNIRGRLIKTSNGNKDVTYESCDG